MFALIEYMPRCWRESHAKAGNSGSYPHNGARRVWIENVSADHLDPDWAWIVETAARVPDGEELSADIPPDAMGGIAF